MAGSVYPAAARLRAACERFGARTKMDSRDTLGRPFLNRFSAKSAVNNTIQI
jgi:hypothetical protein